MATLYTVLSSIQAQVSGVTQGLVSNSPDTFGTPLTVYVGLYWPSVKTLQDNVRKASPTTGGPTALITVYDRGLASDSTRWLPAPVGGGITASTMTVTASEGYVQQFASMSLTFAGPITPNDAVGIVLSTQLGQSQGVVAIAGASDTAATMAAQTAALLQANATIMSWLTVSVVGSVIWLTSMLSGPPISVAANVGNGGTTLMEIARRKRHFQIVIWARTPDDRNTVADPVEALIARLEANFGLTFPDGTMGRLTFSGDTQHDEATLSDTFRRDLLCCVDYGITVTDQTYAVLAPVVNNTTF
jgi:hypothetical protein